MIGEHIKMALATIRGAKLRSLLTMLGIIIGVSSVVIVVAIGQGVKNQVGEEVNQFGAGLIQVSPGKSVNRDSEGNIEGFNFAAAFGASTLSQKDLDTILKIEGVETAAPMMVVSGSVSQGNQSRLPSAFIIATSGDFPTALNQEVSTGEFFATRDDARVAVIGSEIAETIFGGNSAIGGVIQIRGEPFVVKGVMKSRPSLFGASTLNLNQAVYIPLDAGKRFNQNTVIIQEIDVKIKEGANVNDVVGRINTALLTNHGGEEDFTVLKQEELVELTGSILGLITTAVAAIAAISLVVGGIGVMNIMLVSVTERTREIGLRKAIGATNRQILIQFLIEAVVLTVVGGIIGVAVAYAVVALITMLTDINGAFTLSTILLATGVSGAVGIAFGLMPAAKAARKHPIEALRYE
jgi:putative ABC transport system permease protein